jgi:acetyl esterase/lipase
MSWRLSALNLVLRLFEKPALARIPYTQARLRLRRQARRLVRLPRGSHVHISHLPTQAGDLRVEWVSHGRPDRRRIILYLHGGAYVLGSPRTHRRITGGLARATGARVMTPEYRLAPEHPFPAALDDVIACYRHLLDTGYDPSRIGLAGDSAGGGLAFGAVVEMERLGLPAPAAVAGFSPWADLTLTNNSLTRNALRDPMLPVSRFAEAVQRYLGDHPRDDPRVSPVFGAYAAPPPALIHASRTEVLLDDALALADQLRACGGDVRLQLWQRTPHAWHFFAGVLPEADEAIMSAAGFFRTRLTQE